MKKGTLFIEIDRLTACLEDEKGQQFETISYEIEDPKLLTSFNSKTGWYANWKKLAKTSKVFALALKDSPSIIQGLASIQNDDEAGVTILNWAVAAPSSNPEILKKLGKKKEYYGIGGHLFAIALRESIKAGYQGVVIGYPSDRKLFEHYQEALGAKPFDGSALARGHEYTIVLEGMEARHVYQKYTFEHQDVFPT